MILYWLALIIFPQELKSYPQSTITIILNVHKRINSFKFNYLSITSHDITKMVTLNTKIFNSSSLSGVTCARRIRYVMSNHVTSLVAWIVPNWIFIRSSDRSFRGFLRLRINCFCSKDVFVLSFLSSLIKVASSSCGGK